MTSAEVREGTFSGGLPYLALGSGEPLVYLSGFTLDHRNPKPGLERTLALRTLTPLARAGFEVYFTNRWPGMAADTTFADIAERHAEAIRHYFGAPVDVLGASTGGSVALQLIADRPDVVRRAVIASAAYALGPVGKEQQLKLLQAIEETGQYPAHAVLDVLSGKIRSRWLRALLTPVAFLAAKRITIKNPADTIAMLRAEDAFDVRDRLADIQTETLVICGAQDPFWTIEMFAETAFRLPHGSLIIYRNRGHALVIAPEFFRDVTAFLRDTTTP
ncbi:MAG TPA: alpha/beta hydrolase [Propionibacteriaceae bacterium]|nr:alpha/beta hydrolase [Propionibacteriaceae bacterium]